MRNFTNALKAPVATALVRVLVVLLGVVALAEGFVYHNDAALGAGLGLIVGSVFSAAHNRSQQRTAGAAAETH